MRANSRKIVFVSSPLRGKTAAEFKENMNRAISYCKWAMLKKNVVPIAPHVIFTRWLDDNDFDEQQMGLEAGFDLLKVCEEVWVFIEDKNSVSSGMKMELVLSKKLGKKVKFIKPSKVNDDLRALKNDIE